MRVFKRSLSRQEKALFVAPLLLGIGALTLQLGPTAYYRASGRARLLSTTPTNELTEIALSADGSVLAATGMEAAAFKNLTSGTVYLWDAKDFSEKPPLKSKFGWDKAGRRTGYWSHALSLSPDGKLLGIAERGGVGFAMYSLENQKELWQTEFSWFSQFSRDGRYVAFRQFEMREAISGKIVAKWKADNGSQSNEFDLAPDNRTVAWIGKSNRDRPRNWSDTPLPPNGAAIEIRRVSDGKVLRILQNSQETSAVAFSPDGRRIISVAQGSLNNGGGDGSMVRCHDTAGRLIWKKDYRRSNPDRVREDSFCDAIFSPDGKLAALRSKDRDGGVVLLDSASGVEVKTLSAPESQAINRTVPPGLLFSPDGKRLYAMGRSAVLVWEAPLSGL